MTLLVLYVFGNSLKTILPHVAVESKGRIDANPVAWYTNSNRGGDNMYIPASIKRHIGNQNGHLDDVGRSGAQVMVFNDMVLKIQPESAVTTNEHIMLKWLQGRIQVPELIEEASVDGKQYLLMSRVQGAHLCDANILDDQHLLADLVAEGLVKLWSVNIVDCPSDRSLNRQFAEIEGRIRTGKVTRETAAQPETYGPGGFESPAQLLDWLIKNKPKEELVLSHGDYCLPNVFAQGEKVCGFIDLGCAGIADKWQDIETAVWSMWANTTGKFGGKCREFDRSLLFEALGMTPDEEKLRYYSLLSELF